MSDLPIEKEFVHAKYVQSIEGMSLEEVKSELERVHLAYLKNQAAFVEATKKGDLSGVIQAVIYGGIGNA